ncbi:MAG: class I SAM-dependent methyltransferase [Phycisphaerales bacterium]
MTKQPENGQSFHSGVLLPRRSVLTSDYQRDWPEYYTAVEGKPPRDTLLKAAALFAGEGDRTLRTAIDIGCGSGRDSHELLRQGWRVWATDFHEDSKKLTVEGAPSGAAARLVYVQSPMEELPTNPQLPQPVCLVNASFALPFCKPEAFESVWRWIKRSTAAGGRFAGQFFGDRDEWMCVRRKSHFTRAQLEQLFRGWTFEHLEEVEKEGDDATGRPKYHHVFHVVAKRHA